MERASDWVAIDFETATGSRASACALAVVIVRDAEIVAQRSWLIRPPANAYSFHNTRVHGMAARHTASAPAFADVWPEIAPHLDGRLVLAHNAGFDVGVLRAELDAMGAEHPCLDYLCTVALARRHYPHLGSHRLPVVAERCGVPLVHHDPASDALAAAMIALRMCEETGAGGPLELARALGVAPKALGPR